MDAKLMKDIHAWLWSGLSVACSMLRSSAGFLDLLGKRKGAR